jgi:D-alanyl-D-alanine carboxypeptidase
MTSAEEAEHGAEPAPAPATPTTGVDETPPGPPSLDGALTAELQRLLDDTVVDGFIPGAVLSISIPGSLPWSSASGVADRQRDLLMKPDTLVHIGSVTKMFTAVVVLQLAGEGKIDLDAPIGRYLPGIVRFADSTTVRHLLSHTSGIYDYQEDPQFIVEAYEDPEHMYDPAEMVAMADQVGIVFRPGTPGAWRYSSTNYVILGMLVEQVTGRTLAEELRARIFEPLELTHTFFAPYDDLEGTPAQGYIGAADRVVLSMTFVYGTANIVSTADDLRRFTEALFDGRLLADPSLALMTTLVDTGGAFAMPELEYGLGVMGARMSVGPGTDGKARPDELTAVLGHIGGIAGFRSAAWWAPESGITIALSLNQAGVDPNILARDVFDAILTWQGR